MRIYSASMTGHAARPSPGHDCPVLTLTGDRDGFINICLALVLAMLVFFMLLSIYLVVTKPIPIRLPTGSTYRTGGSAFAVAPEVPEQHMRPLPALLTPDEAGI